MTQVIHGMTREQLIKRVFGEKNHTEQHLAMVRDSRSNNSGNSKKGE